MKASVTKSTPKKLLEAIRRYEAQGFHASEPMQHLPDGRCTIKMERKLWEAIK